MDLTNELVVHPAFGTGRVTNHDDRRITIQFFEESGEKRFIYPDAFEKYLNMCNTAAAQKVLADLIAKTEQIAERQQKQEEAAQKAIEHLALAAQKRKNTPKAKPPKTKASDHSEPTDNHEVSDR